MEELTGGGRRIVARHKKTTNNLQSIKRHVIDAYQDTDSPAFSKSANTVRAVLANKFPKLHFTNHFVKDTLNELSTTYSRTRLVNKNKHFFGTSFYSPHPHHRWHVDLQDMSIFRKSNISTMYNFMLVCVDDFSNYIMIKLLRDKKAKTVHTAMINIIKETGAIPTILYCDKGSEFDNRLFNDPKTNFFKVQFTVDRRKAVYAERAIRTIRKSLEQLFIMRPNESMNDAVRIVMSAHNSSPSRRNPLLPNGIHASPRQVTESGELSDEMERLLRNKRLGQYKKNITKRVINKLPKFKIGDIVRYLKRKSKFSKEASLTGNWSDKMYNVHSINEAHSFKPMHTYVLGELGTGLPVYGLPAIREDFLKKASNNPQDTFILEKVLNRKGNKVLVKWLDYEQPTWEPISNIPKQLLTSWKERKGK